MRHALHPGIVLAKGLPGRHPLLVGGGVTALQTGGVAGVTEDSVDRNGGISSIGTHADMIDEQEAEYRLRTGPRPSQHSEPNFVYFGSIERLRVDRGYQAVEVMAVHL